MLGDFEWNGVEDFIQKCFDNDKIKNMVVRNDDEAEKDEIAQDGINDTNYDIETNVENEEVPVQE
jgi:FixJ family two-component response regulator